MVIVSSANLMTALQQKNKSWILKRKILQLLSVKKKFRQKRKRHTSENTRRNTMQNTKQKSLQGIGNGIWKRLIIFARSTMKNTKNTTNNTGMKSCRKRKRQEHGRIKKIFLAET